MLLPASAFFTTSLVYLLYIPAGQKSRRLQAAAISIDDTLDIKVSDGMIMLVKPFRHKTLEERAAEFGGKLALDGEFDWGKPVGREVW